MPTYSIPSLLLLWGFECIVSLRVASLGYEFVHVTNVAQWVVMVRLPKGFLKVTVISQPCPISTFSGWLGDPRGLYPACFKSCYKVKLEPFFSGHRLPYHEDCHPIFEDIFGIVCACTIGPGGSHLMSGVSSMSLGVGLWGKTLITQGSILIKETHYVMLDTRSTIMSW
jgi:hypothetical protein